MSQTSGIGSSREDRPPTDYAFNPPSSASKLAAVVQETVLNPEGRRLGTDAGSSFEIATSAADSQIWKRLFPGETDHAAGNDVETTAACELGHFVIEERIGAGGMGAVFRALDTRLQRVIALKVLSPSQSRDRASVLRFQNEARAAARLDHENIARVFYIGEDRGLHFIAFEYVTGQNVRDLIARTGRLAVPDAVNYALQIATALRHTASAGVVHRDIKPSNIIITPGGRAKLVDLGLARKLASDGIGDLTIAGTTLGTFDYISPEQARDPRNVDVRSDIYSLGCTLYHMLTGGPPYSSGTVLQKLLDHQSGQAPDPRTVNAQIPPMLSAVCRKMMAGDPKNRYLTPDELIRDLAGIAASLGLRPMPAEGYVWARAVVPASPRIRSGLFWAASLAVVILLAVVVDRWPMAIDPDRPSGRPGTNETSVRPRAIGTGNRPEPLKALPPQQEPAEARTAASDAESFDDAARASSGRDAAETARRPESPSEASSGAASGVAQKTPVNPATESPISPAGRSGSGTEGSSDLLELVETARALGSLLWSSANVAPSSDDDAPSQTDADAVRGERPPFETDAPFILTGGGTSGEWNQHDSLAQAVDAAFDGDTIELHFDGPPPDGLIEPFTVRNKTVTIRAGVNAQGEPYRPILSFAGDSERNLVSRMITISGEEGGLDLQGVEIRMAVEGEARNLAGRWALFSLSGAERVRLTDVTVTIANPTSLPLAVFDLRLPDGVDPSGYNSMMGMMRRDEATGFVLELERSFIRGETDFVTVGHTLPGRITANDSAFAIGAALLNVAGGIDVPLVGTAVEVQLDHVTAVIGQGVLRLDLATSHQATRFRVSADDSVFATTTAGPVVQMEGDKQAAEFEQLLTWNGQGNVFDGFSQFWTISDENGATDAGAPVFQTWLSRWKPAGAAGGAPAEQEVPFRGNIWDRPGAAKYGSRAEVTADDLALDPAAAPTGVVLETAEGSLIGAATRRLPTTSASPADLGDAGRTSASGRESPLR